MNSRRMIQTAAVLLLAAATVVMAVVARTYWRDRNFYERAYTEVIKSRDIVDTTRNAVSALQDAEAQTQGYVLTGETSYSVPTPRIFTSGRMSSGHWNSERFTTPRFHW